METIISSVIAAIAGGVITWFINRRKPHHLVCHEEFRGVFDLKLPETSIMYRNIPVKQLGLLRLRFRNTGSLTIENLNLVVSLDENTKILDVLPGFRPGRSGKREEKDQGKDRNTLGSTFKNVVDKNTVEVMVDRIIPHRTNQEVFSLDIFTDGEATEVQVFGNGVLRDGTAWGVIYQPRQEIATKIGKRVTYLSNASIIVSLVLMTIFMYSILPSDFLSSETWNKIRTSLKNPFLWVAVAWLMLTIVGHLYGGFKGLHWQIAIPFSRRALIIRVGTWQRPKT